MPSWRNRYFANRGNFATLANNQYLMMYRFIYRNFATCSTAVEPYRAGQKALPLGEAFAHGQASLRTTSQSASQTAPLVGEPLAKRRGFPVCQGLPSIGEVARRRRDGEVFRGQAQKSPPGRMLRGEGFLSGKGCVKQGLASLPTHYHQAFIIVTIAAYVFPSFWNVPAYSSASFFL